MLEPRTLLLFSGLTEPEKDTLLKNGRPRNFSRGDMLFFHGEPVTHFYLILAGNVQVFRENQDGDEKTVHVLKAGHTICESEILDACKNHRAHAKAVSDVQVLEFPLSWLKESARQNTVFALNLLSLIAAQAHMAEIEAEHQATMSAPQLVACFLQRLCMLHDFDPKGFELPYSKTLIASRLGMELETFSRTIGKLKEHGITVEGMQVKITDLSRIEHYVCGMCTVSEDCATHKALEKKARGAEKRPATS